jgi:hypothetical protein
MTSFVWRTDTAASVTARRRPAERPIARPAAEIGGLWRRPRLNQTATSDFGHFCAEVPKSLHIGAYPRVFLIGAFGGTITKSLQGCYIRGQRFSETGVIAMQKVVGSNPISRFFANCPHVGHSALAGENRTTSAYPSIWSAA